MWMAPISEDQSIFASCILLPVSYESWQNSKGDIKLLFLDGTSGLVNEPYVNIIWMHMMDSDNHTQLVGQLLLNGKSTEHYKAGLRCWKELILGSGEEKKWDDLKIGTWGQNCKKGPSIPQLKVTSTMTDKELAMLKALKDVIKPDHRVLCRFHILQAMVKKVCFLMIHHLL